LRGLDKTYSAVSGAQRKATQSARGYGKSVEELTRHMKHTNREQAMGAIRYKVSAHQINNAREAMQLMTIAVKDMFTAVGFLNTVTSIMISRFGSMLVIFAVLQGIRNFINLINEASLEMDTNFNRVASIVVSKTEEIDTAMGRLATSALDYSTKNAAALEQISNTMFFLASAGRTAEQISVEYAAAQDLVIATSKDLTASLQENKDAVEVFAGILNIYGDNLGSLSERQEKAQHLAAVMFEAFKTQQILIAELATGLSYAASQARQMGISQEELIATVAVVNTGMLKGSKAGTSYANALRDVVKNSGKLKEKFGAELTGIGEDLKFMENVIGKVHQRIKETGVDLKLFQDLFEVWNIRGARFVLTAAVQFERYQKLIVDMKTAQADLEAAMGRINNSLKGQKVITSNLKKIIGALFGLIFSGGYGIANLLKTLNVMLEGVARTIAVFGGVFASVFGTIIFILEATLILITKFLRVFNPIISMVTGFEVMKFKNLSDSANDWLKAMERNYAMMEFGIGKSSKFNEVMEESDKIQKELTQSLELLETARKDQIKTLKAYNKSLDTQLVLLDKFGKKINLKESLFIESDDITRSVNALNKYIGSAKLLEEVFVKVPRDLQKSAHNMSKFNPQVKDLIGLIESATKESGLFVDKVNEMSSAIKATGTESREALGENLRSSIEAMLMQFEDDQGGFLAASEDQIKTFLYGVLSELNSYYARIIAMDEEIERVRLRIILDGIDNRLNAEKEYFDNRRALINRMSYEEFRKAGLKLRDVEQVSFIDMEKEIEENEEIAKLRIKTLEEANEAMRSIYARHYSDRLSQATGFAGRVIGVESATTEAIIKMSFDRFKQAEQLTKHEKNQLQQIIKKQKDVIRGLVESEFQLELEKAWRLKRKAEAEIAGMQVEINEILSGGPVYGAESNTIKELQEKIDYMESNQLQGLLNRIQLINKEISTETENVIRNWLIDLGFSVDQVNDLIKEMTKGRSAELIELNQKVRDSVIAWNRLANVVDDVASTFEVMGKQAKTLRTLSTMITLVSNLTEAWGEFRERVIEGTATMLSKIGSTLGIISALSSAVSTIISIFSDKEDERKQLQEEFLDPDAIRRITPDYGQARIVNNTNILDTSFDLIDVSQLSRERIREIAEALFAEWTEIQKSTGD
jgi:TP901 family phage tail tape measure protein